MNQILIMMFLRDQIYEIGKYKWIESEKAGKDLNEIAIDLWINKFACAFRNYWWKEKAPHFNLSILKIYIEEETNEIAKYKWIESEKANYDLAIKAVQEWIFKYRNNFFKHWLKKHIDLFQ